MLAVIGFDYKDDVSLIREIYDLEYGQRIAVEKRVYKENRPEALAMLITCTRIEFYFFSNRMLSFESAERALGLNHIEASKHRYQLQEKEAVIHLYELSSGILSPLFGEDTIVSQISEALERSIFVGQGSGALNRLLSSSISFSRNLRKDRKIRVFDSSISSAVLQKLDKASSVLVIGSGELARSVVSALLKDGKKVLMTLRDMDKTFLLVPDAVAVSYDERRMWFDKVDAVISASSGLYYTIEESDIPNLEGKILIDLAIPYDIPTTLNPIRLEELDIDTPIRNEVVGFVSSCAKSASDEFFSNLDFLDIDMRSEDVSLEVVRRMHGHVEKLDALSDAQKKSLLESIGDSVKKAYIAKQRQFQKTRKSLE